MNSPSINLKHYIKLHSQSENGHKLGEIITDDKRLARLIAFYLKSGVTYGHYQYILKRTLKPSGKSGSFFAVLKSPQ